MPIGLTPTSHSSGREVCFFFLVWKTQSQLVNHCRKQNAGLDVHLVWSIRAFIMFLRPQSADVKTENTVCVSSPTKKYCGIYQRVTWRFIQQYLHFVDISSNFVQIEIDFSHLFQMQNLYMCQLHVDCTHNVLSKMIIGERGIGKELDP